MLNISFLSGRVGKDGTAPVMMWLNLDGCRKTLQLPIKVKPNLLSKMQASKRCNQLQEICNSYRSRALEYYNSHIIANTPITAEMVVDYLKGKKNGAYTIGKMFEGFFSTLAKRAENEITIKTYNKYKLSCERFCEIVSNSTVANTIVNDDIVNYKHYLINHYKLDTETLAGYLKRLKAVFEWGVKNNKIQHNPFNDMKISRKVKDVVALTADEVRLIENINSVERINKVRDLFLFSCYTGLSFVDGSTLTTEHITNDNGVMYIKRERQKTGVQYIIPLSPKAIAILEKYNYCLPSISNQKTNAYLKEIADIAGITKNLHFHLARHTALTLMLNNGIPIEVVSKIAGHSKIQMTQHYSKVVTNTVLSYLDKM